MKKMYSILVALFLVCVGNIFAQIPNSGFEQYNSDGSPSYWGKTYLFSVTIDTSGEVSGDTIVIDHAFYERTSDAHSGNWAMEMRNGQNFSTGEFYAGGIGSSSDSIFSGFQSYNTVSPEERPTQLGFYYKYIPAGPDWAWAHAVMYDSSGLSVGEVNIITQDSALDWTYIYAPIDYWMEGVVAYYTLDFSTAAPCGMATFGTRFLVDDITFGTSNAGIDEEKVKPYRVFPNPSTGIINIETNEKIQSYIYNSVGDLVFISSSTSIDLTGLASGIYYLQIKSPKKESQVVRVVKK